MGTKYSDAYLNAPSRFHEIVGPGGHAPQVCMKAEHFEAGHDPLLNKSFDSKAEKERYAAKRGAIKMTGDQFMQWSDDNKAKKKKADKERLKKLNKKFTEELVQSFRT